jgi:hypothetical protein
MSWDKPVVRHLTAIIPNISISGATVYHTCRKSKIHSLRSQQASLSKEVFLEELEKVFYSSVKCNYDTLGP